MKRSPSARRTFDPKQNISRHGPFHIVGIHPYIKTSPPYILSTRSPLVPVTTHRPLFISRNSQEPSEPVPDEHAFASIAAPRPVELGLVEAHGARP